MQPMPIIGANINKYKTLPPRFDKPFYKFCSFFFVLEGCCLFGKFSCLFQLNYLLRSFIFFFLTRPNMSKQKNKDQSSRKNFSRMSEAQSKQSDGGKKNLTINERFLLQSLIPIGYFYKCYKGIDISSRKYVIIYIKPSSKEKLFSKNIKEELREKVAPPLKWSGTEKIDKNLFDVEVHTKYGPSLHEIMINYRKKVSQKTLYLLAYHLLKLIDRVDNAGYVNRSLGLKNVILGQSVTKNDLYFLNTFDFERKNEESFSTYDIKYCSIGTHLKLKTCSKDTLESMCYALMDFYLKGSLFINVKSEKEKDYLQEKSTLKPEGVPVGFLQFFEYVRNLNYGQQIKFTQWKIKFKRLVPEQDSKHYEWVSGKMKNGEEKSMPNSLFSNLFGNSRVEAKNDEKENQPEGLQDFDMADDHTQLSQGETDQKMEIRDKIVEARFLRL